MATDPDIPQLIYGEKYLRPEKSSYSFTNPDGARRSDVAGGPSRITTDHLGGPFVVTVGYECPNPSLVQFFQAFWLFGCYEGSVPFQCALALESSEVQEDYVVRLKSAPTWNGFTGDRGRVSCTYEVEQRV